MVTLKHFSKVSYCSLVALQKRPTSTCAECINTHSSHRYRTTSPLFLSTLCIQTLKNLPWIPFGETFLNTAHSTATTSQSGLPNTFNLWCSGPIFPCQTFSTSYIHQMTIKQQRIQAGTCHDIFLKLVTAGGLLLFFWELRLEVLWLSLLFI